MRYAFLSLFTLLFFLPTSAALADDKASGDQASGDKAAADAAANDFLKDKPYMGLVIGITRGGEHQVYGYGQVTLEGEQKTPDGDTLFEIGSITKTFTATILAQQVLAGAMQLDDPVQKHLPAGIVVPRRDNRDITLLHLATHTSSLPVQPPTIVAFANTTKDPNNPYAEYDQEQLKLTLKDLSLSVPIGSEFTYSNLGTGLLGMALANNAKVASVEELFAQRITGPLKMASTCIQLSPEQAKRLAVGHDAEGKPTSPWTFACLEACGGLRSNVNDMLLYADADLKNKPSSLEEAFAMTHQPWREMVRKGDYVGLSWMRRNLPDGKRYMLWHNGGTGGYRTVLITIPDSGLGVVVLSNGHHLVDPVGVAVLNHLDKANKR